MNRIYPDSLHELIQQSKETDGAIFGNPLLYPKCSNAILHEHASNLNYLLKYSGIPTPWFWSRETLDATIKNQTLHRRLKVTHKIVPNATIPWSSYLTYQYANKYNLLPSHMIRFYYKIGDISSNTNKNYLLNQHKLRLMNDKENYMKLLPKNALFYHIPKTGSSSMSSTLEKYGKFERTFLSENVVSNTQCGFTFVRDPIQRFVSGYYTVNRLIYGHNKSAKKPYSIPDKFTFWNKTGEPQRITEFIKNLLEFKYDFLVTSPLEHMMSQTSILSIAQLDIHFIGKLKKFKNHFAILRDYCVGEYIDEFANSRMAHRMVKYGTKGLSDEPEYAKMMGLQNWNDGDLLPGYKVIADDYYLYQSLVEYYRQDFICFGFDHDFNAYRKIIYDKLGL